MRLTNSTKSECHLRLPSAVTMLREKTMRHSYIERPSLCTFSMPSHKRPCSRTILVSLYSSSTTRWRLSTFFLNSSGFLSHSSAASPFNGEALDLSQYGTLEQRGPTKLTCWAHRASFANSGELSGYCTQQSTCPLRYPSRSFPKSRH
jgi:hypothetical protein